MATNTEIRVKEVIRNTLGLSPKIDIPSDANLSDDLGADAIDLQDIPFELEDEFDKSFDDNIITSCQTVGDIVNYVGLAIAQQEGASC